MGKEEAHQRVLRYLKVTNIFENGEKSSKQITCCNDQKSTVAKKGKSPALQRGLMNFGARTRNRTKDTGIFNPLVKKLDVIH
ncbi:hypothetical protein EGS84_00830 [Citrobacter koseri]|uniref:Uncharacterized protein n=1 Tax=Citrobacter koseri TaxID=545 RepID=A0AAQ1A2Z6_CITKO|nr:hypothetical protein EGS84_00830 [Citrobacter koseri]